MGLGDTLLELQDEDLALLRDRKALSALPELVTVAKKRKSHARLKAEAVRLLAARKDCETAVAELTAEIASCREGEAAAHAKPVAANDRRAIRAVEEELAGYAKRLDRAEHLLPEAEEKLAAARSREEQLAAYTTRFEAALVADARRAKAAAEELQARIAETEQRRERLARRLPDDVRARYEAASKRFGGLAVEVLEGAVPSICRTALQAASLEDVRRAGDVGECPYCHRILVRTTEAGR